jgi:hypothetical protein
MTKEEQNHSQTPKEVGARTLRRRKHVAGNRADAQRAKLDAQAEVRAQQETQEAQVATTADCGKVDLY